MTALAIARAHVATSTVVAFCLMKVLVISSYPGSSIGTCAPQEKNSRLIITGNPTASSLILPGRQMRSDGASQVLKKNQSGKAPHAESALTSAPTWAARWRHLGTANPNLQRALVF